MKSTPENSIKKKLQAYLKGFPDLFYYSATAGFNSTGGIPDVVGSHNGRFFALEVKAPGRRKEKNRGASALQVLQMDKIRQSGGFTMVFDGEMDDWCELREFLEEV